MYRPSRAGRSPELLLLALHFAAVPSASAAQASFLEEIQLRVEELQSTRVRCLDEPTDAELRSSAGDLLELFGWLLSRLDDPDDPLDESEIHAALLLGTSLRALPGPSLVEAGAIDLVDGTNRLVQRLDEVLPHQLPARTLAARWLMELGRVADALALLERELAQLPPRPQGGTDQDYAHLDALLTRAQLELLLADTTSARTHLDLAEQSLPAISEPVRRAYLLQFYEGERMLEALALGRQSEAVLHYAKVEEAARTYSNPALARRLLRLEILLLQGTGAKDEVREKLAGLAGSGVLDPEIDLEGASLHLWRAIAGDEQLEPALQMLRSSLVRVVPGRSRFGALANLALGELRAERVARARETLVALRAADRDLEALSSQRAERAGIIAAVEAMIDWRAGAERERLLALRDDLRACLRAWVEEERSRPTPPGSGLLAYPEQRLLPGVLVELELALDPVGGASEALQDLLDLQRCHELARGLGAAPCELFQLRAELLPAGHGMLLYFPTPAVVADAVVIAFDASTCLLAHFGDTWTWEEVQSSLAGAMQLPEGRQDMSASEARAHEMAKRAGELLLPPGVRALALAWEHWTIVGADAYGELPYDGLEVPGLGTLGSERSIAHIPSLPWALARSHAQQPGSLAARGSVLLGAPAGDAGDTQAWDEVLHEHWSEVLSLPGLTPLVGARARLEDLRARGPLDLLSILAHGEYDPLSRGPSIRLAPAAGGGIEHLGLPDLASIPEVEVVLIGSCGAASGATLRGNAGMAHFGGRFLAHGARCVLAGAGDLALRPTSQLLAGLHRRILQGSSLSDALREGRRELVAAGYTHPAHAAAIKAYGLAHGALQTSSVASTQLGEQGARPSPVEGRTASRWWWLVLGLLPAAAWLARRRRLER